MEENTRIIKEPKFTRGEKCIFIHLVVTFVIIFVLIMIYVIHLYLVDHSQSGIFSTRRCALIPKEASVAENPQVGYLYLNLTKLKFICNILLLAPRWSVCPAHCIAMRSHPSVKHLYDVWRIRYRTLLAGRPGLDTDSEIINTRIKRHIVHPHFDQDSFANNIGLLKHTDSISFQDNFILNKDAANFVPPTKNMVLVGWKNNETEFADHFNEELFNYGVNQIIDTKCLEALAPVTMVRSYEFCITLNERSTHLLDHGSIVFAHFKPVGIFSWGEKRQKVLPMVVINMTAFKDFIHAAVNNEDY